MLDSISHEGMTNGDLKAFKSPTGWGRQHYAGKRIRKIKNYRTDLFRPNELKKMSFIQRFVAQHISGLKLRKRDGTI
ncbi:hypothetical protein [Flavicella marina]|uniref:hypothetical protein n=1 Tax=Flavicella marina TaxID=1475951 RepID=UPI001264D527|nr:hypothetical protein [Flavicella marina]